MQQEILYENGKSSYVRQLYPFVLSPNHRFKVITDYVLQMLLTPSNLDILESSPLEASNNNATKERTQLLVNIIIIENFSLKISPLGPIL